MKYVFAYATGSLALLLVTLSILSAIFYAWNHNAQTVSNLGMSTLSGIGMAIGGCIGSGLILRFKAARKFLQTIVEEVQGTSNEK